MRIGSLGEAAQKCSGSRSTLARYVSAGRLHVMKGSRATDPVFVSDEAQRAAGLEPPPTFDFGEPPVEDVIREVVEASLTQLVCELRAENEALKARVRALESLHAYRAGPPIVSLRRAR